MPASFKEITLPGLTGMFDALSTPDQIGWGNFRLRKNISVRGVRKACRRGGWTRLFADVSPYNNQDLHDQLLSASGYYEQLSGFFNIPGGICDYAYPYFSPGSVVSDMYDAIISSVAWCGYYVDSGLPKVFTSDACFIERWTTGFPYEINFPHYGMCNSGFPFYYQNNSYYIDCSEHFDQVVTPGFGYGTLQNIYCNPQAYSRFYCDDYLWGRTGCKEAITLLHEVNGSFGRRTIAATMSRIYESNYGTGDWVLLADGLGSAFTEAQCTCSDVRFMADSLGDYTILTNGLNTPLLRQMGGLHEGCNVWAANPIDDLTLLEVQAAGGVVAWKGFFFLFDVTSGGVRNSGEIIWSDFDNPTSWVPGDTSQAGRATVAVGETILNAAELGNFLYLYTDRSIWRVTLVGGDVLFAFDQIYSGTSALRYKYSLVNTGAEHLYMGNDKIYKFTQFDQRPMEEEWLLKASAAIYRGMHEADASFMPVNKDRCNQAVGGWNEEFKEAWFSWPTGNNTCPDMTLVLNMQYYAADLVDYGFTAFQSIRPDIKPTFAMWMEDQQICTFDQLADIGTKEGQPCIGTTTFTNPPLYLINPDEDINQPTHPDSLCAQLAGKTEDDFCRDCPTTIKFLMASASDFTIKEYRDDVYYREEFSEIYGSYCAIDCEGTGFYFCFGYDSVLQSGADDYGNDAEKTVRRFAVECEPVAQTTPNNLHCSIGFASQAVCDTFIKLEDQPMKCLDRRTDRQREDQIIREDQRLLFPTFYRGKFISWKLKVDGTGGGVCFGSFTTTLRLAEGAFSR